MNPPCHNCLTLPICRNQSLELKKELEKHEGPDYTTAINIFVHLGLGNKCDKVTHWNPRMIYNFLCNNEVIPCSYCISLVICKFKLLDYEENERPQTNKYSNFKVRKELMKKLFIFSLSEKCCLIENISIRKAIEIYDYIKDGI